jgi:transposase-like protein
VLKYIREKLDSNLLYQIDIVFDSMSLERYEYIKEDLRVLRDEFTYQIECFILDGAKQVKKAIEEIYPDSKIQRCLTHIKRQIRNMISNKPQSNC